MLTKKFNDIWNELISDKKITAGLTFHLACSFLLTTSILSTPLNMMEERKYTKKLKN